MSNHRRSKAKPVKPDADFQAWLEIMDYQLMLFFLNEVPDISETPWEYASVRKAEAAALARFSSVDAVLQCKGGDDGYSSTDGFVRYLGTVFVHMFDGEWRDVPTTQGSRGALVVALPLGLPVEPLTSLTAAVYHRTGNEWSEMLTYVEKERQHHAQK